MIKMDYYNIRCCNNMSENGTINIVNIHISILQLNVWVSTSQEQIKIQYDTDFKRWRGNFTHD